MRDIPADWTSVKVREAGQVQLGRQRSPATESGPNMVPYLRVANVFDGFIDYSDVNKMNFSTGEASRYKLLQGDILLNEGQSLELVGRSAIYEGPEDTYCFQNTLVRFRCSGSVEPRYARAVFKRWLDVGHFATIAKQTTSIAHLGADRFARLDMPLPPLAEQRSIAAIVSTIEDTIRHAEQIVAKLKLIRQGLLHDLLTRGVDENGKLRDTRYNSHHFREVALGEIALQRSERGRAGLVTMSVTLRDGLQPRDSDDRRVESKLAAEAHLLARRGDVAYNMMRMWQGACGIAQTDCLVSPAYVVVAPTNVIPSFLYILLKQPEMIGRFLVASRGLTSDRYRLYYDDFAKIAVTIPRSLDEQRAIVGQANAIDQRIAAEQANAEKLGQARAGLMDDLLTGRVRTTALLADDADSAR